MRKICIFLVFIFLSVSGCGGNSTDSYIFELLIRNIATPATFTASNGQPSVIAFGPAIATVHAGSNPLFTIGASASAGFESFAEDADITALVNELSQNPNVRITVLGVNPIEENATNALLLPQNSFRILFNVEDTEAKISLALQFIQSNDVVFATGGEGIALFDANRQPIAQDITSSFQVLDAGTENNESPGAGTTQTISQTEANQGAAEGSVVRPVDDGFSYPNPAQVLQVTITPTATLN